LQQYQQRHGSGCELHKYDWAVTVAYVERYLANHAVDVWQRRKSEMRILMCEIEVSRMRTNITKRVLLTCLLFWSPNLLAAKESLVDLARRLAPKPIVIERQRELIPSPFEPMVSSADLIVHATVRPIRTYLSEDQVELFTDYVVTPLRIMYERSLRPSKTPGAVAPIALTVWGGRTMLEGVEVELRDKDAPRLDDNSEVVLYLREDTGGSFRLVSEVTGALGVTAGKVNFLNREQAYDDRFREIKGLSVEQLDAEVRRLKQ
jgi:hypothetical protein